MNLRQLKYFVRIVELGSMTRAAEQLHVAQPALGMQIRQLEEDLGVALLIRHSRGVEPTAAGTLLAARARDILDQVERTRREVIASVESRNESIRLGLTPSLMLIVGPEVAMQVREHLPQVFLSLSEDMSHVLVDALARGEIDLALGYDVPDTPGLLREPLLRDDLLLVTLPDGVVAGPVAFAEALEHTLVMPEQRDTVRELVVRTARAEGLEPKVGFEVRSIPAMRNLVLRGAAAAILPMAAVAEEVRAGRLAARRIVAPPLQRTLYLAASTKRQPFTHEPALSVIIRDSLKLLVDMLGPLAEPIGR